MTEDAKIYASIPYLCVAHTAFFISQPPQYLTHFSPGDRQSFDRNGILPVFLASLTLRFRTSLGF